MQALRSRTSFGSSDRMTLPTQSPYRSESLDGFGRKKSSRAPLVVGGLLAVLLLCVCAYLFLGGDGNEHVPVAAYSQQPSKRDPTVLKKKEETTPGTVSCSSSCLVTLTDTVCNSTFCWKIIAEF